MKMGFQDRKLRLWTLLRIQLRTVVKLFIFLNIVLFLYQLGAFKNQVKKNTCLKADSENKSYSNLINENQFHHLKLSNEIKNPWWKFENRTEYFVLRNYIISDDQRIDLYGNIIKKDDYNTSITYTTQGSYEFLYHIEQLCERFDGPISVSVFSPGSEFLISLKLIYYLRQCRHSCIKNNVSWHMIYNMEFPIPNFSPDKSANEYLINNNISLKMNCSIKYEDYLNNLTSIYNVEEDSILNVRVKNHLPYPINVLRNVARLSVNTKYVLASDIELYPSINIVKMFKELLKKEENNQINLIDKKNPHVYILPIFEVERSATVPKTKPELIQLMEKGLAIFFHKWVCDICQKFDNRDEWTKTTIDYNELNIFKKTKRKNQSWEPLYIGTNLEPLYDERLSWDGKSDKMTQMLEMCLKNYDLLILDNAFLCHAPGIKRIDPKDHKRRLPFIIKNNSVYKSSSKELRKKYNKAIKYC